MKKIADRIFQDEDDLYYYEVKFTFYKGPYSTLEEATFALNGFDLGRKFLETMTDQEQVSMSQNQLQAAFDSWRNPS